MHQHIQINHHKVIFTSYTTNFIVTVRNLAKELMEPHCFFSFTHSLLISFSYSFFISNISLDFRFRLFFCFLNTIFLHNTFVFAFFMKKTCMYYFFKKTQIALPILKLEMLKLTENTSECKRACTIAYMCTNSHKLTNTNKQTQINTSKH